MRVKGEAEVRRKVSHSTPQFHADWTRIEDRTTRREIDDYPSESLHGRGKQD